MKQDIFESFIKNTLASGMTTEEIAKKFAEVLNKQEKEIKETTELDMAWGEAEYGAQDFIDFCAEKSSTPISVFISYLIRDTANKDLVSEMKKAKVSPVDFSLFLEKFFKVNALPRLALIYNLNLNAFENVLLGYESQEEEEKETREEEEKEKNTPTNKKEYCGDLYNNIKDIVKPTAITEDLILDLIMFYYTLKNNNKSTEDWDTADFQTYRLFIKNILNNSIKFFKPIKKEFKKEMDFDELFETAFGFFNDLF